MNRHSYLERKIIFEDEMNGGGLFIRDFGKYPPDMRKNLELYGNEKITKLQVFRYPLKDVSFFAKLASFGNLKYDELFHLGLYINGKYILDKRTTWNFVKKGLPANKDLDIMNVDTFDLDMTINELLKKTEDRIGKEKHYNYKALTTNCQYAVNSMLDTIGGNNEKIKKFVMQDMESVTKSLPGFTQAILDVGTKVSEMWSRLTKGEGEE